MHMSLQVYHTYIIVLQPRFLDINCTKLSIRVFPYSLLSNNNVKQSTMQVDTTLSTVKEYSVN